MARAGVTYIDVAKAAEVVRSHGEEPTVDRVRDQLGTGSKSTIAPLLKRWRSDSGERADIDGLPGDLVEVVKSLHERVQQLADHKMEQGRKDIQHVINNLRDELTTVQNSEKRLLASHQEYEQRLSSLANENAQLSKDREKAHIDIARLESQLTEAQSRLKDTKQTNSDLKQENRDIRSHFEHYQLRIAEDRQHERELQKITTSQLDQQLHYVTKQLEIADNKMNQYEQDKKQMDNDILVANQSAERFQKELIEKNAKYDAHQLTLTEQQGKISELEKTLKAITEQHQIQKQEQITLENKRMVSENKASKLEQQLGAANDKIDNLTDEIKFVLQEKALLQGQLKQIQSTL